MIDASVGMTSNGTVLTHINGIIDNKEFTMTTNFKISEHKDNNAEPKIGLNVYRNEQNVVTHVKFIIDPTLKSISLGGYNKNDSDESNHQKAFEAEKAITAIMRFAYLFGPENMELGLHLFQKDLTQLKGSFGHVASYSANAKYRQYVKYEGWNEIGYMKVAEGIPAMLSNIGPSNADAQLIHTYLDMLLVKTCNFVVLVPRYLATPKQLKDGSWSVSWIDTILDTAKLKTQAERIARYRDLLAKKFANENVYQTTQSFRNEEKAIAGLVVKMKDGSEIDISAIPVGAIVHSWLSATSDIRLRTFEWDGSNDIAQVFAAIAKNAYVVSIAK